MTKSLRSVPATGFSSRTHVLKSSAESWTVPLHCWSSWLTVNVLGSSGKLNFKVSLVSRLKASSSCFGSTSSKTGTGNTTSGFSASGAEGPEVHPEIPKKKTVTRNPSLKKRIKELSFFFLRSAHTPWPHPVPVRHTSLLLQVGRPFLSSRAARLS